jgi:hypothetical protein
MEDNGLKYREKRDKPVHEADLWMQQGALSVPLFRKVNCNDVINIANAVII